MKQHERMRGILVMLGLWLALGCAVAGAQQAPQAAPSEAEGSTAPTTDTSSEPDPAKSPARESEEEAEPPPPVQPFLAAGEKGALWLVVPAADAGAYRVLYASFEGAAGFLPVGAYRGLVQPGGLAAGGDQLYTTLSSLSVQSHVRRVRRELPTPTFDLAIEPALPQGVELVSLVYARGSLWAFVRVPDMATLKRMARDPNERAPVLSVGGVTLPFTADVGLWLPPVGSRVETPNPLSADASGAADVPGSAGNQSNWPVDRLMRLQRQTWGVVPLPEDWVDGRKAVLAGGHQAAGSLYLVSPDVGDGPLRVYELAPHRPDGAAPLDAPDTPDTPDIPDAPDTANSGARTGAGEGADAAADVPPSVPGEGAAGRGDTSDAGAGEDSAAPAADAAARVRLAWRSTTYDLDLTAAARPVLVEGQLVLGERLVAETAPEALTTRFWALRAGRVQPLGEVALDMPSDAPWALVSTGGEAIVLSLDDARGVLWGQIDLRGNVKKQTLPLTGALPALSPDILNTIVVVGVLTLTTLAMVLFWRRDPTANAVQLPDQLVIADLPRRGAAALFDLVPCLIIAMVLFQVSPRELQEYWPGVNKTWATMAPGLVAIGLFLLHSTIFELVMHRSLGKLIMGLRVTTLKGEPPRAWQILVRNFMKVFDLLFWLLLLVMMSPYRQRLGDLVAQTIVVAEAPKPEEDDGQDDEDS